jgi:predicted ATPase
LRALLAQADVRVVTLSGPGGVGKSRLAIEAARAFDASIFPDGVAFVPLASTTEPSLVLNVIANQLGARERPGASTTPFDRLVDYLRAKRILLVLDNFEQVVDAAADLARLLAVCPSLTVLVTSRTALRIRGEHELAVSPLDVERGAAVQLFLERAR